MSDEHKSTSTDLIVPPTTKAVAASVVALGYEVVNQVTRDVKRQIDNVPFYVMFEGPMDKGPDLEQYTKMKSAVVAPIVDLETGEFMVLICNAVLESELRQSYPDEGYVGKSFAIVRNVARKDNSGNDRRYKSYRILELKKKADVYASAGKPVIEGDQLKKAKTLGEKHGLPASA